MSGHQNINKLTSRKEDCSMYKRIAICLSLLLFGVVLNITVAWLCIISFEPSYFGYTYSSIQPGRYWSVGRAECLGVTRIDSSWSSGWGVKHGKPPHFVEQHRPHWSKEIIADPSLDLTVEATIIDEAAGWPYRSFASDGLIRFTESPPIILKVEVSGITMSPFDERGHGKALPLRPIWPGFALNTLFYMLFSTAIWICIIKGSSRVRNFLRLKRGLCIKCSYDLRNDYSKGCPECGWRRNDKEKIKNLSA